MQPNTITKDDFLLPVIQRNKKPDGTVIDPDLLRRMDNPICQQCHEDYKKKYPGKPFNVVCKGIFDERSIEDLAKKSNIPKDTAAVVLDPIAWAAKHIHVVDENGDISLFKPRNYQEPVLACTAARKVDRMGRGMGKTLLGVIEEIHKVTTQKNFQILILCPAKAQAKKWFDDILWQCEHDPELDDSVLNKVQQPFYEIKFKNGSRISIFTAGSSSGRDADVIRSQSPHRIRLEEQDLLSEGDYKAVNPLLRRYKKTTFHGSSTPTGSRSTYWQMCTQFSDYKEFFAPITLHPDFNQEYEDACRREARTEDVYQHEFLAEFGDLAQGVFKSIHIDACRANYRYKNCRYNPKMKYFMGVDWNGQGTGTRIRIIEYDTESKMRKCVQAVAVDGPAATTQDSLDKIKDLNRYWHCTSVYIDAGFGHVQDELLRLIGKNSKDPDDKKLMELKVIDFGASIKTNKLVPNRGQTKYLDEDELERRTKPFMVEGAVMAIEQQLFQYSDVDDILDAQFRAYRVKTWSQHGFANTYEAGKEGDHDLDALMLALLGIELEFGLFFNPNRSNKVAAWARTSQFGGGPTSVSEQAQLLIEQQNRNERAEVPSRQMSEPQGDGPKVVLPGSHAAIIAPIAKKPLNVRVPSRTTTFRTRNVIVPTRSRPSTGPGQNRDPFRGFIP